LVGESTAAIFVDSWLFGGGGRQWLTTLPVSPEKEYEKKNHECSVSTAAAGERDSSLHFMMAAIAAVEQLSHLEERSRAQQKTKIVSKATCCMMFHVACRVIN
jgi:hypothetical protein